VRHFATLFLPLFLIVSSFGQGQASAAKPDAAKDPTVSAQIVDSSNRTLIHVIFDYPLPKVDDISAPASWVIYIKSQDGKNLPQIQRLDVDSVDMSTFTQENSITLKLRTTVPPNVKMLDTTLLTSTSIMHLAQVTDSASLATVASKPAGGNNPLTTSANRGDSDVYFNGSYTATEGGSPIYNVDAFAGYMQALQGKTAYYGKLGAYGQLTTKTSPTIDPNSFLVYLVYQRLISSSSSWHGQFQIPYFNYRFAGSEMDKSGAQINFIDSPVVTFPVRLSGRTLGRIEPGLTVPHMTLTLGTEFVDVEKSVLAPTGTWHTRGLASATFTTGFKAPKPMMLFDSVELTSSYQVRILSAPEIFYDPKFGVLNKATGKTVIPPMLGTQPRHYVDTKLSYCFAKWAAFTFENTYGSLPPVYLKTDQTFALGLSFTLKQTSYGRYSILRP